MARRRRHHRRHYARENPVTDTELIVGGLVTLAVVGIGGYLIYQHYNTSSNTIAGSAVPQISGVDANGNPTVNTYPVAPSPSS
jgi:hypothetical protein